MPFPIPKNEPERIAALKGYEILDTPPEEAFDQITRLLSTLLEVPIALVSFVDESRQWFKSRHGIGAWETPRDIAFCAHAIMGDTPLMVADALKDERFADNPLVINPPGIRFYCGAPLRTRDGFNMGTLSVIDLQPRELTELQIDILREMAAIVVQIMDLRQTAKRVVEYERSATSAAEQVSERKTRELKVSEERFRTLAQVVPVGIFETNADGACILVNERWCEIAGLAEHEALGNGWAKAIHPEDRALVSRAWESAATRRTRFSMEYRFQRPDGKVSWVLGQAAEKNDESGNVTGYVGSITDISTHKELQHQLAQARKMEAVGQLTSGIAHDFNNLITVIRGNAELMIEKGGDESSPAQTIVRATARGQELTHRLLAFSRRQALNTQPIDLTNLVDGMSDMLNRTLGDAIEIETKFDAALWIASADPGQVENALLNMAINARDAMPRGGRLTIEVANFRVDDPVPADIPEAAAGNYVVLSVTDTGVGMTENSLQHAFEPFFTTKEVGQGSGLGLSMIYGFAKQSGGHLTIESEQGHGTTVRLYLPRAAEILVAEGGERREKAPRGNGETILVVEDSPDVRTLAVALLERLGYHVQAVETAAEAWKILDSGEQIDLVLCDINLPGGTSGLKFVQDARAVYPDLRTVFMSGDPTKAIDADDKIDLNTEFLAKPFSLRQLGQMVRAKLD